MQKFAYAVFFYLLLTSTAFAAEKLTVMLDWFVNPDHGPLILAKEKGFFKARDLDVEFIAPSDPNDPPKLVAAGKADIAVSYQPQLHLHHAQGLPLVWIGTLIAAPLNSVVVLADGPVKTLADLKGKTVGFSVGGFEDALLGAMLEKNGLKLSDVKLVNVNFALSGALMSRKVDGVIGAFRNFELNQLTLEGKPGRAFYPEESGVPPYDELILIAAKNKAASDKRLRRFIDGLTEASLWIANRPNEAWAIFRDTNKAELDTELNRRAWRETVGRFDLHPGALDRVRYQRFAEFLKQRGLIKEAPPLDQYTTEVP